MICGKSCGPTFLRQVKCAENYYVVAVPKDAKETANAKKLHWPAQLCASVLDPASDKCFTELTIKNLLDYFNNAFIELSSIKNLYK